MDGEVFFIGLFLGLIFCGFLPNTSVTAAELRAAHSMCAVNGGVEYVRGSGVIRSLKVVCNNGVEGNPKVETK